MRVTLEQTVIEEGINNVTITDPTCLIGTRDVVEFVLAAVVASGHDHEAVAEAAEAYAEMRRRRRRVRMRQAINKGAL